ncbi:MAG: hypothetical protein ACQEVA_22580 [Myxococcota bacterium]
MSERNAPSRKIRYKSALACFSVGIAVALTLSGCSALQGVTNVGTGGAAAGSPQEKVMETFNSFELSDCRDARSDLFECGGEFVEKAGLIPEGSYIENHTIYNPRDDMENPDERWLLNWEKLPTGNGTEQVEYVYGVLATAAIRKNWAEKCSASYAEMHQEQLVAADEELAAKIKEARSLENIHERIRALTELRTRFESDVSPLPRYYSKRLAHTVGGRYELEKAIVEELRAADLEVLYDDEYMGPESELLSLLRPRMSLEEETEAYCGHASVHGADGLAPVDTYPGVQFAAHAYTDEQREALQTKVSELRKTSTEAFALSDEAKKKLEKVEDARIKSVASLEEQDEGLVIVESTTEEETVTLGCRDLDRVKKRHPDGRVEYHKECDYAERNRTIEKRHQMPALPEGVELEEGSSLSFVYFRRDHATESKGDSKRDDVVENYELDVLFVTEFGDEVFYSDSR